MRNKVLDQNGVEIKEGDRLRFHNYDGCIWDGDVVFEDGCLTVSILNAVQVKNPNRWERSHDWIASRSWGCTVGHGEFGTWNCPRAPLTRIADQWRTWEEVRPLYEKFGFGNRILKAEVMQGTIREAA